MGRQANTVKRNLATFEITVKVMKANDAMRYGRSSESCKKVRAREILRKVNTTMIEVSVI